MEMNQENNGIADVFSHSNSGSIPLTQVYQEQIDGGKNSDGLLP